MCRCAHSLIQCETPRLLRWQPIWLYGSLVSPSLSVSVCADRTNCWIDFGGRAYGRAATHTDETAWYQYALPWQAATVSAQVTRLASLSDHHRDGVSCRQGIITLCLSLCLSRSRCLVAHTASRICFGYACVVHQPRCHRRTQRSTCSTCCWASRTVQPPST
jgi:hypothetical protein